MPQQDSEFNTSPFGLAKAANRWLSSPADCLKELSDAIEEFELRFQLTGPSPPDGDVAWTEAKWKGTFSTPPLLALVKRLSYVQQVLELCRQKKPDFLPAIADSLPHLLKAVARWSIPSGHNSGEPAKRLGKAFVTFRVAVRTLIPSVVNSPRHEPAPSLPSPADTEFESTAGALSGQQFLIFKFLSEGKVGAWTNFDTLKLQRHLWQNRPDPCDIEDNTVFEALKKLRAGLAKLKTSFALQIEKTSTRTKLSRSLADTDTASSEQT